MVVCRGAACPDRKAKTILQVWIIEQLALEEDTLRNHVVQWTDDVHEEQVPVGGIQVWEHRQHFHSLRIKVIEHVRRHILWLVVLPWVVELLEGMPEDTFMQGFPVHKSVRTSTEVINAMTLFHSVHILLLIVDDVAQFLNRIADDCKIALFVGWALHKDGISRCVFISAQAASAAVVLGCPFSWQALATDAALLGDVPLYQGLRKASSAYSSTTQFFSSNGEGTIDFFGKQWRVRQAKCNKCAGVGHELQQTSLLEHTAHTNPPSRSSCPDSKPLLRKRSELQRMTQATVQYRGALCHWVSYFIPVENISG